MPQPERRVPAGRARIHPRCQRSSDTSSPADVCGAVRKDAPTLRPPTGYTTALPQSAGMPSVHRRPTHQVQSHCGCGASQSRARSSRLCHPTDRVRVLRSAHTFHAAFRPHLAVTPLHFTGPSAPRTPGQGTFSTTHDRMHSTHAPGSVARCCVPRPLSGMVHRRAASLHPYGWVTSALGHGSSVDGRSKTHGV
jgi:hypothetical protein